MKDEGVIKFKCNWIKEQALTCEAIADLNGEINCMTWV
jgi:hypothetical protein